MRCRIASAVVIALLSAAAAAQDLPPGTTVTSASLTGLAQFDTDLDGGGSFRWAGALAAGSLLRQVTPQFAAGFSAQYDYQRWHFSGPTRFGSVAPWREINQPQLGATFIYAPTEDWTIVVSPSVAWSYANGASTGDALTYGAVLVVSKDFSPTLSIGIGAAIFRQIDETKTFPFLAIDWQINDRWRLSNPFAAGPTGGAGLELTYAFAEGWETGFGGTYREFWFRLDREGPVPDGIGEQRFIPVFVRVSRTLGKQAQLDFYAAAFADGEVKVRNRDGNELARDDYATAPALGVTLRYRF
jgi:hypothetical protein